MSLSRKGVLNRAYLLVDPSPIEEAVADGIITVCMNGHGEVCCINSAGGTPLSKQQMLDLLELVRRKHAVLNHVLNEAVASSEAAKGKDTLLTTTGQVEDVDAEGRENVLESSREMKQKNSIVATEEPGTAVLFQGRDSWE